MNIQAIIFDLDGVIVDTAKYHFLAWKELAMTLSIPFDEEANENLKGVSRMQSLEILLQSTSLSLSALEKEKYATQKNLRYLENITTMDTTEMLPGVLPLLVDLKKNNIKIALGSASKNAIFILERLGILDQFDEIVDGNMVTNGKPNPDVFLLAANLLNIEPQHCIVIEDAVKGVEAAINAGMKCIGIGDPNRLQEADWVIQDLTDIDFVTIQSKFASNQGIS